MYMYADVLGTYRGIIMIKINVIVNTSIRETHGGADIVDTSTMTQCQCRSTVRAVSHYPYVDTHIHIHTRMPQVIEYNRYVIDSRALLAMY